MTKLKLFIALALCAAAMVAPAQAQTSNEFMYNRIGHATWYDQATGEGGWVNVAAISKVASSDATATREETFFASASLYDQIPCCSNVFYPSTAMTSSPLTIDPIGNTARIQFTRGNPLLAIDLELSRPRTLNVTYGLPRPNAWVDAGDGAAHADTSNFGVYLDRQGYALTGSVNGIPLGGGIYASANTVQSVGENGINANLP